MMVRTQALNLARRKVRGVYDSSRAADFVEYLIIRTIKMAMITELKDSAPMEIFQPVNAATKRMCAELVLQQMGPEIDHAVQVELEKQQEKRKSGKGRN